MKFNFGDVVVVDEDQIGVIVKSWEASPTGLRRPAHHEVYVRSYNGIREYDIPEIKNFIHSKYLSEEEKEFYS